MNGHNRTSKYKIKIYLASLLLIFPIIIITHNCSSAGAISNGKTEKQDQNDRAFLFSTQDNIKAPKNASFAPIIVSDYITLPVNGYISSAFGFRNHPVTNEPDFHTGIDIAAPKYSPIYAALSGKVIKVASSQINGNYIEIEHSQGFTTLYCHCDSIIAKQGAKIKKGERIAKVGNTGITSGYHLHFEVRVNSVSYNPLWVVK